VVAGKVLACQWVLLACKRHLDDLQRSKHKDFPFRFEPAKAERVCIFIQNLPHTKGKWADAGETIKLEPWQLFIVCCIFGWVFKSTGLRRFREAYIEVPRKNAKSTLAAGIGLYMFCADGEFGAEVYSGATTEKQAWEVFRPARLMVERTPALQKAFGITVNAKSLTILKNGSKFEPLIGKPGDGASPSCAIADEYHEHPDDTQVDTMRTGMGARENPLMVEITTSGFDRSGPCYQQHLDVKEMLEGKAKNNRLFGIIYTTDEGEDWKLEQALRKANPNFGVSVFGDFLKEQQIDAVNSARKQNPFLTKHLDIWVNSNTAWINPLDWDKCADKSLKLEDFAGQECVIGLDLASRVDLASKVYVFKRQKGDKVHYFVFAKHYLNEAAVQNARATKYAGWANEGKLIITPGDVTDYNWIAEGLIEDSKKFVIREVAHDPYHAAPLVQFIQARDDWPQQVLFVEFRQIIQLMSPAMKELEASVIEGTLHHDGDPVLGWCVLNVVCHTDAKDNIFPRKEREENKIDGAVALLMGKARSQALPMDPYRASIFDSGTFWGGN
jgi:phage terminase large subunit-like protein